MPVFHRVNGVAGTIEQVRIVKRMRCKQRFEVRRRCAVKMNPGSIQAKPVRQAILYPGGMN